MNAAKRSASTHGFTLVEVLAAIFLMSIVMSIAVNMYVDISRSSEAAIAKLQGSVQGLSVLDRVARDVEAAVLLVKPEETDPLYHPWIFYAEAGFDGVGADRLKFMSRNHQSFSDSRLESDLATITYVLQLVDDGTYQLRRWSSPHLPEEVSREFPTDEEGSALVADGIRRFGFRFFGEGGEWVDEWDSTTLLDSGELPLAVELSLVMAEEDDLSEDGEFFPSDSLEPMVRRVLLPVRPIDVVEMIERGLGYAWGEGDEDECITVNECATIRGNGKARPRGALYSKILSLGVGNFPKWRFDHGKACIQSLDVYEDIREICKP